MLHAHVQSLLQSLNLVCLLVRYPSFRYPRSMFMLLNAEMTPEMRERARENFRVVLTLYVTFAVVLDENLTF